MKIIIQRPTHALKAKILEVVLEERVVLSVQTDKPSVPPLSLKELRRKVREHDLKTRETYRVKPDVADPPLSEMTATEVNDHHANLQADAAQMAVHPPLTEQTATEITEMLRRRRMEGKGRKDDANKPRYDLIPVRPLSILAYLYALGARKYTDRNWEKGLRWGRVYRAMISHALKWWGGEQCDQEDGQHHLASVVWCAFALMEYETTHPELDDRPVKGSQKIRQVEVDRDGLYWR